MQHAHAVVCDSVDELEAFVTLVTLGTPKREVFPLLSCRGAHVAYSAFEEVKAFTVGEHDLTIVKLSVIAMLTPMGVLPVETTVYMAFQTKVLHPSRIGA